MSNPLRISIPRDTLTKSCEITRDQICDIIGEYADLAIEMENNDYELAKIEQQLIEKKRTRDKLHRSANELAIDFQTKKRSIEALERFIT
jgi:hypothetical protein